MQDDFLRDVLDGQVAGHVIGVIGGFLPGLALEGGGWELGGVEEVGAQDVGVAFFVGGIDRADFDRGFDGALFRSGGVIADRATDLGEAAGELRDDMTEGEAHRRVDRIDGVGFGRQRGGSGEDGKQGEETFHVDRIWF